MPENDVIETNSEVNTDDIGTLEETVGNQKFMNLEI